MEPLCSLNINSPFGTESPTRLRAIPQPRTPPREEKTEETTEEDEKPEPKPKLTAVERLLVKLPQISDHFTVLKKIGEGAFSNVFLATCKNFEPKKFAIKHLTPTSHPSRIIQEMRCLQNIGGQDNVVKLECCLREKDAIAFIMPYFPHDSFSQYVTEMNTFETQLYMKNLLIALRRVHSFNIIHRDVKPTNFLYNRQERRFLLVDFGLAHKVDRSNNAGHSKINRKRTIDEVVTDTTSASELKRPVLHSLSGNVPDNGDRAKLSLKKKTPPLKENSPLTNKMTTNRNINQAKRNLQFGNITVETKREMEPFLGRKLVNERKNFSPTVSMSGSSFHVVQNSQIKTKMVLEQLPFRRPVPKLHFGLNNGCGCDKKASICNKCVRRKAMHAPRAGTPGYRPPEVLLKYPHQTTAVDVWSAGVMMLSIMSGSYPFFYALDDISALMEMIAVFGTDELRHTATKLGRRLLTMEHRNPLKLSKLCETLRRRSTGSKKDVVKKDVDGKLKHISSEKKAEEEAVAVAEAKVEEEATMGKNDNAMTEKRVTKMSTCHSCYQKIHPKEGCLCKEKTTTPLLMSSNGESRSSHESTMTDAFFPKEAYDLLAKLLAVDPEKRITADVALSHPFFLMDFSSS